MVNHMENMSCDSQWYVGCGSDDFLFVSRRYHLLIISFKMKLLVGTEYEYIHEDSTDAIV